ncbi:MAG: ABC transporter permease, partial [Luteimonas sp.]
MNALMSRLPPIWREAVEELWRRRLRTLLTLLGLIFGVGAIVAMQAVGEGSRREALRLVEGLGLHNLIAEARQQDEATLKETRQRSLGLTVSDAEAALAAVPGAERWAAEKRVRTHSVFSDHGGSDAQASGVSADWFSLSSLPVAEGRALGAEDEDALAAVAVLGHQAAADLFPA